MPTFWACALVCHPLLCPGPPRCAGRRSGTGAWLKMSFMLPALSGGGGCGAGWCALPRALTLFEGYEYEKCTEKQCV